MEIARLFTFRRGVIISALGFLIAAGFITGSGIHYRWQVTHGIEPAWAPRWVGTGFNIGLLIMALGLLWLLICLCTLRWRKPDPGERGPRDRAV